MPGHSPNEEDGERRFDNKEAKKNPKDQKIPAGQLYSRPEEEEVDESQATRRKRLTLRRRRMTRRR